MSLSAVREYFAEHALALGYRKHSDGFATDNIPSTKLNRAFHVEAFNFTGSPQNQMDLELRAPATVRLYFKAHKNVDDGIAVATDGGEVYLERALKASNRLGVRIKNILLNGMVIEPHAETNDNVVVCRLEFTAIVFKGIS